MTTLIERRYKATESCEQCKAEIAPQEALFNEEGKMFCSEDCLEEYEDERK